MFLSRIYLNTIPTSCPWILRCLAVTVTATLSCKSSSAAPVLTMVIREVVMVIQTEEYQYQDPITSFLNELYVEFDFEKAQRELGEAKKAVGDDFFLGKFRRSSWTIRGA